MKLKAFIATCILFGTLPVIAQQSLNNQSILKMHDAGMSDDLIVATINAQPGVYLTTLDDMIALKKAGIDDKVITAMVSKGAASQSPANANTQQTAPQPPSNEPLGKPRVFLVSASKGPSQNAARDQSMEMSKDFERDCPDVRITLNQSAADYTVSLNHIEIGLFIRDNQFQIADHNGDLLTKTKEGGSIANGVKKACATIMDNWDSIHPEGNTPAAPVISPPAHQP